MNKKQYRPSSNKPSDSKKRKTSSATPPRGRNTAAAKEKAAPAKKSALAGFTKRIKDYNFNLRKQKYKYNTVATVFTIAVVTSVILLNVLIGIVTDRYGIKFDMTSDKRFEITKETKDILRNLDEKVTIDVFSTEEDFRAMTYGNEMAEILNKIKVYGGDMVELKYVDPLRNPTYADRYKSEVTIEDRSLVVKKGEYFSAIDSDDYYYWYDATQTNAVGTSIERKIASKILGLGLRDEDKPTAAILLGHNELNISALRTLLIDNSYNVITLNLLTSDIPDEVSVLIINSPNTDYSEDEMYKIEKYLGRNKNLIFFYGSEVPKLTNLELFFKEWGATFEESVVCDSDYRVLGEYFNIVTIPSVSDHELTAGLGPNQFVVLPFSREMHVIPSKSNLIEVTELLSTSNYSYAKPLTEEALKTYEREEGDKSGPFSGAILLTKSATVNNFPVYTNVLFVSSPYLYDESLMTTSSYGNLRFMTNILAKFNSQRTTVSVPNKTYADPELKIVGNSLSITLILLCIAPVAALLSGILIWHRRKNR